jgi:flagellar motor protein MotB
MKNSYFLVLILFISMIISCKSVPQQKQTKENQLELKLNQTDLDYNNLQERENYLLLNIQNFKKVIDEQNAKISILNKQLDDLKKTNSDITKTGMNRTDLENKIIILTKQRDDYYLQIIQMQAKLDIDDQIFQQEAQRLAAIEKELKEGLADLIAAGEVDVYLFAGVLVININDKFLFDPDSAAVKKEFYPRLTKLAEIFKKVPDRDIRIEGHTASGIPSKWSSSWELGAMRAVNVVRFLQEKAGIDPQRIRAVSLGEYRPLATNKTEDSRKKNRRVSIVLINRDLFDINQLQPVDLK